MNINKYFADQVAEDLCEDLYREIAEGGNDHQGLGYDKMTSFIGHAQGAVAKDKLRDAIHAAIQEYANAADAYDGPITRLDLNTNSDGHDV